MRRRPSCTITASSYAKHGSYATQFGIAHHELAVAVLVLQTLARERRAAGGRAEQEAARAHVACGPHEVADALEAEHRVVDVEGDHVVRRVRVRGRGRDPRAHRTRLVDAFLEDLALLVLTVREQLVRVLRRVQLARDE
jgi:hypothetical protein